MYSSSKLLQYSEIARDEFQTKFVQIVFQLPPPKNFSLIGSKSANGLSPDITIAPCLVNARFSSSKPRIPPDVSSDVKIK